MTDHFSMRLDMDSMIRAATKRIADQAESALRDAVVDELRNQGWTVLPPQVSPTPSGDERQALIADLEREAAKWSQPQQGVGVRLLLHRAIDVLRRSEVPEQGEPSDAQVLAALNTFYVPDSNQPETLAGWGEGAARAMRSALRAAGVTR